MQSFQGATANNISRSKVNGNQDHGSVGQDQASAAQVSFIKKIGEIIKRGLVSEPNALFEFLKAY